MPHALTETEIARYHADGFLGSIPVLTPAEVAALRAELEAFEKTQGKPLDFPERSKPYLLFNWADTLVRHPRVLDAVEDVIGPDILVYHTTVWIKEPNSDARVFWHQDDAYFHLDPPEQITAWVALSEAGEREGCMRMLPGSHRNGLWAHSDKPVAESLARRGQNIGDDLPEDAGRLVPLRAGEMSFHNTHTVHASGPNRGPDRRIGIGISYIPAHVRPLRQPVSSALLVRGRDAFGHYHPERGLARALSEEARAEHARCYDLYMAATRIER
jgi:hypothetical protein